MGLPLRHSGLLPIAALVVAILAGCGGGDDSNGTASTTVEVGPLTKQQFIERADAICRRGRAQFERRFAAYIGRFGGKLTKSELSRRAEELVEEIYLPANERQINQIRALGAPRGDEDRITALLAAIQSGLVEARDNPVTFVRALSIDYRPFARAEELARAYGLSSCGRG